MSVRRIMGTEIEYGIAVPGHPHVNAMNLSTQVVTAYGHADRVRTGTRWDYEQENPLRDARGFELERAAVDQAALTDEDPGLANVILTNGARLYVDHAHPEYSTPEVTNPLDAVVWDKAGEVIIAEAAARASTLGNTTINAYKNNTDNKGASYGSHENYLLSRATPFPSIVAGITPFFVTRQVICGAGRVGIGQDGRRHGFQLSQRADFIEAEVGLETTLKRPIVNTRDEPHADPDLYRRFHVIVGDANLSEVATLLKLGTTSLVLAMIEAGHTFEDLALADPVAEIRSVSHDPELGHRLELSDGRRMTAVEIQFEYLERSRAFVTANGQHSETDADTAQVLAEWEYTLTMLAADPTKLADRLDWVAKKQLLDGYRRRDGLTWSDPRLALIDLQYSDVRPDKGLYHRLVAAGRMRRLVTDDQVRAAMSHAPEDTRAWFRGECLRRFAPSIAAASWDSLVFDLPGSQSLTRVPTPDPYRGTRAHVEQLLNDAKTADELVAALLAS